MNKIHYILFSLLLLSFNLVGQAQEKVIYIVDSIPVIEDPDEGDEIIETDIADITVIKNRDTLKLLGYDKIDGAIIIFTKEYRKRPEDIKQIPSSKQMERINGIWHFRGLVYNGIFIDYYYSGRKQSEGTFQNGKLEGIRTMYHQNGQLAVEKTYSNGIGNGIEKNTMKMEQ